MTPPLSTLLGEYGVLEESKHRIDQVSLIQPCLSRTTPPPVLLLCLVAWLDQHGGAPPRQAEPSGTNFPHNQIDRVL